MKCSSEVRWSLQEMFKKAAYLSTGSVDSRPTFQRDAVDDDCTGSGPSSEGGVNVISWKDMNLGKGPLQGAAYGSMVMPQFKGGRKANRQKKLPNMAASDVRIACLCPFSSFLPAYLVGLWEQTPHLNGKSLPGI
jgi:hypothetical protein